MDGLCSKIRSKIHSCHSCGGSNSNFFSHCFCIIDDLGRYQTFSCPSNTGNKDVLPLKGSVDSFLLDLIKLNLPAIATRSTGLIFFITIVIGIKLNYVIFFKITFLLLFC